MSATVERSAESPWRNLSRDNGLDLDVGLKEMKRPKRYFYRLASESSKTSEDDTESVYSLQDKETDVVRDTSDTESQSDNYEIEFEYEVASLSESDQGSYLSSSDPEDLMLAAAAAVIYQSDVESWLTDVEESDSSSDDTSFARTGFTTCAQCRVENDNPLYRYCEKCYQSCRLCKNHMTYKCFQLCQSCYQDRKRFFPPRPRRKRKPPANAIRLATLQNCLSGLSQDSGVGSSQECCPSLGLEHISVPEEVRGKKGMSNAEDLTPCSSQSIEPIEEIDSDSKRSTVSGGKESRPSRKRPKSDDDSSESETISKKKPRTTSYAASTTTALTASTADALSSSSSSGVSSLGGATSSQERASGSEMETELCVFCNSAPKDSIFLHTNIAHRCCCYPCAKKTLQTTKRCPICNRSVNKVVKIFTS